MDNIDFFISCSNRDANWAEWIAMQLRLHGYSVYGTDQDLPIGVKFVEWVQNAIRQAANFIILWSENYKNSSYCSAEYDAIFLLTRKNPEHRFFLIRVSDCPLDTLSSRYVRLDLFKSTEDDAVGRLLSFLGYNGTIRKLCNFPNSTDSSSNFNKRYFEEYGNQILESLGIKDYASNLAKLDSISNTVSKMLSMLIDIQQNISNAGNVTNIRTEHFHSSGLDASGNVNIVVRRFDAETQDEQERQEDSNKGNSLYVHTSSNAMIREMYHLCKTPLETVKIALRNLVDLYGDSISDEQRECIDDINNDIKLVDLIIGEYRRLVVDSQADDIASAHEDIEKLLAIVFDSACRHNNKTITANIGSFPDNICVHGNYFVIVLCKPLIDNAVEAAPNGSEIRIECQELENYNVINIENECASSVPDDENLQKNGFTSKPFDAKGNPGGGEGLSGIRHIVYNQSIAFEIHSDKEKRKVTATLRFPKK